MAITGPSGRSDTANQSRLSAAQSRRSEARIASARAVPGKLSVVHDYAYERMNMQVPTYSIRHVRKSQDRAAASGMIPTAAP
jgi:hypothetical protein